MDALNIADEIVIQRGVLAAAYKANGLFRIGQGCLTGGQQSSRHTGKICALILAVVHGENIGQALLVLCIIEDKFLIRMLLRDLLDSSVKLMDGKSPLEIELPGPLNLLKKPLLKLVDGNVVGDLLKEHGIIKEDMVK